MSWKIGSLDRLFNPKSIAVIGASDKQEKLGALSLLALQTYTGEVYPVNPRLKSIGNSKCYSSMQDINADVDMAMIAVGPQHVLPAIADCAEANVGGAIIFSAGFKELGGTGIEHQTKLRSIVDEAHIAVIGPNCLGAGNPCIRMNASPMIHLAVPSQSLSISTLSTIYK